MAAEAGQPGSERFLGLAERSFRSALERAAAAGEIEAESVQPRARLLLLGLVGTNLLSKSTGDRVAVGDAIDAMRLEVQHWQQRCADQATDGPTG